MARREPQRQTWRDWTRYVCPKCAWARRLPPDDERDCPRCDALMRVPPTLPKAAKRRSKNAYNTENFPMRPWVRCEVCGGIHWVRRPIAEQCPGPRE